jgi:hypothetical protein
MFLPLEKEEASRLGSLLYEQIWFYLLLSAANGNLIMEAIIKKVSKKAGCVDVLVH